jgi:sarcosine dehydrogenase
VKLKSNRSFLGREAMEEQSNARLKKRLVCFVSDDPDVVLLGRETILRNGEQVGYLTSGGFGYTIGKPIGFGYVRNAKGVTDDFIRTGTYELIVAQARISCEVSLAALYDPANVKVRA